MAEDLLRARAARASGVDDLLLLSRPPADFDLDRDLDRSNPFARARLRRGLADLPCLPFAPGL